MELPNHIPYTAYITVIERGLQAWHEHTQTLLDGCTEELTDLLCALVDERFANTPAFQAWAK